MNYNLLIISLLLTTNALVGQSITGQWNGVLNAQGTQLRLVFHIEQSGEGYKATFDSPDQGAKGIPFSSVTYNEPELVLEVQRINAVYRGTVAGDSITGTWTQGGQSFPLNLSRKEVEKKELVRPQEPRKPYPYTEEEVIIENKKDNVKLAGTLTLPGKSGKYPVVILITGSGAQNRDEEIFGHKPFLVLADYLTRQGIAVLRYDDRGYGKSTGNFNTATTADFATDVLSAIAFLKGRSDIDPGKIGLVGHSEGGIIAPLVANKSEDVAFLVLLAGTGTTGKEVSLAQAKTLRNVEVPDKAAYERFSQKVIEIAASQKDVSAIREELVKLYNENRQVLELLLPEHVDADAFIQQQVNGATTPWVLFFYNYNPADELEKITIPVLSLNGSNDVQVPAAVHQPLIKKALEKAGNKNFTVKELPGLNHMFQQSKTGAISEYANIEQTFSPVALEEIARWIQEQIK